MIRWLLAICLLTQYGFSHNTAYNTAFQDEFLRQERQYLAASGIGSPFPAGYIPFTITNNSTFADTEIYILILTNNASNIITFTNTGGLMLGQQVTPPAMTYVSAQSSGSYTLNSFNNNGSYVFYLPTTVSMQNSRIYFSVGNPIDWIILANGPVQVAPLDFIDLSQDGYYTVYDKQEFNLNANNSFVMNPTLVDYYGIPLSFYITSSNSNTQYAGLPPTLSSTTIFSNYNTAATALPVSPNSGSEPDWAGLSLTYQAPSDVSAHPLRVLSPGSSLKSSNPIVAVPAYSHFSTFNNYYLSANNYTAAGCNWYTNVWKNGGNTAYYQAAPIYVDLSVAGPGSGVATGQVDNSGVLTFTVPSSGCGSGGASGFSLTLPTPTSSLPFYTGSLNDYTPAPTIVGPQAYAVVLWEVFSAAILAGIVPLLGTTCEAPLTESYIRSQTLFQPNTNLACTSSSMTNPPWYDFYSKTFLGMGTGNYTKYYTFPYADVWATDGTITITNLPQANAQVFITIGDMTGIVIPNPFNDSNSYTVTFTGLPGDGTTVTFGSNPNFSANPQISQGVPYPATGGAMYMGVTYSTGSYAGKIWGTHIIPSVSTPALKPVLPGTWTISQAGGAVSISIGASP